jgi:hypothetical protein
MSSRLRLTAAAAGAALLVLAAHLVSVLYLTKKSLADLANNFSIEQLGSYGDSIAPLTAAFAFLAAIFSALAYRAQRDTLEHERDTAQKTRFDELFFRALHEYDAAKERLDQAASRRSAPVPRGSRRKAARATGHLLLSEVWQQVSKDETPEATEGGKWAQAFLESRWIPVGRFIRTCYAILIWLDAVADKKQPERWMSLFRSRMTLVERQVLREALTSHADSEVRDAAIRLGLFTTGQLTPRRPKPREGG